MPLLLAACVGACRTSEVAVVPPAEPAPVSAAAELTELLRYGNDVRELDSRQLEEQYRELSYAVGGAPTSAEAIKMSLLLSAPNAPFHDIDQATRFLRDVMERDRLLAPEHAALATFLYNLYGERVYAASEDETLATLLTQTRDRNEELTAELAAARAELASERERAETLQGQLDALKELEEQLSLDGAESP